MDWKQLVAETKATGLTQKQIAESIGIGDGTLSELCSGKITEPKWSKGDALIALHAARVAKASKRSKVIRAANKKQSAKSADYVGNS